MQPTERSSPPKGFRPDPFAYHEEIELEIESLTNMGQGLGRIDGRVIMVKFALPDERVRARIYRNDKNYSDADLIDVLRPSPARIEAPCPYFTECGGCQYQHLDYASQLDWKTRQVKELLWHMAKIEIDPMRAVPSPKTYAYRSKLTPHFPKPKRDNHIRLGFLRAGSRFNYVEIENCPLASQEMNEAMRHMRDELQTRQKERPFRKGATVLIREHLAGIATDPREIIQERIGELIFSFPAGEFFQTNPSILPAFTEYVAKQAASDNSPFLVDAYCGSGLFCLTAARRFERAIGIEISEPSIQFARKNATANRAENVEFVVGDASGIFEQLAFDGTNASVIIDPPRKGSDQRFLDQLTSFRPRTIVYVSCNPATQMRDLASLLQAGYDVVEVQPFDLFPQTKHLECVVTLRLSDRPEKQST